MSGCGGMTIACLATNAGHAGGAAIALERLARGLRSAGAGVELVTRDGCGGPTERMRRLDRRIRRGIRRSRTAASNTLFTADWPAWDLAGHPAVVAADVVNVHWVAGFLAAAGVRRIVESGRPVAWTLHDMRPFTGGCHYAAGCERFTAGCESCPQLAAGLHALPARGLARARRRLAGLPLVFVAPSRWIATAVERSSLFDPRSHQVRLIPNGIDLEVYRPGDRAAARRRLGLPAAGLVILLGSVSLAERRKGADVAAAALAIAAAALRQSGHEPPPPVVLTYGTGALAVPGLTCRHLGPVDEAGVLEALAASDVHLALAREDNLPNTVMESLACGVPVIATRAGGLPEMVADGAGWLVDVDDAAAAAEAIVRLVRSPGLATEAGGRGRLRAIADWDDRIVARRHLELFAELAAGAPGRRPAPAPVTASSPSPAVAGLVHPGGPLRGPLRRLRRLVATTGLVAAAGPRSRPT